MTRRTSSLVAFLLTLASAGFAAQDPVQVTVKGETDRVSRYSNEVDVSLAFGGQQAKLNVKETVKTVVKAVSDKGDVTFERVSESTEQTLNGDKLPEDPTSKEPTTYTLAPDGTLVSYKSGSDDPMNLGARIFAAQNILFSTEPVKTGDTWTVEIDANNETGTLAATATFKVTGFENLAGVDCIVIESSYQEKGTNGISAVGKNTVEVASGDVVKSEFELSNVPFPGPNGEIYASAKGKGERTEGSPVSTSGAGDASEEEKPKTIDETVKGYDKSEGIVTLYRKTEDNEETVYMELGQDVLGKLMMLQATAATGNSRQVVAGNPIGDLVFRFEERQPGKINIVVPNFAFRADDDSPMARSVARSFAEAFVEQFDIEARQPDRNSVLIDVSDLFKGDISRVSGLFQGSPMSLFGGGSSFSLDRQKTYVESYKLFPTNLAVSTVYNFAGMGGGGSIQELLAGSVEADSRSIVLKVIYNMFALPMDTGYVPRLFDNRVGFFTVMFQDFTQDRSPDQNVQHILRWNLKKKDPSAAVSEPVKPITFWLDNAIPEEYRESVKNALLTWNQAFLTAGFKDAIVVEQMPSDADFDPSDMRYNVVRWVSSPGDAYAVALFRPNPITGEILNASITVDANIVRAFASEYQQVVRPSAMFGKKHAHTDPRSCTAAQDGMLQFEFGKMALGALPNPAIDEKVYIKQFIEWVVTHEMGHIMGLRHNFVASTELDLNELADKETVEKKKTSASVMDYVAFNVSALKGVGVPFFGPGIGDYDHWAITYGYRDFGASRPEAETSQLHDIASQGNEPGLLYLSDEAADGFDPYVTRFDISAEPLGYWSRVFELSRSLMASLGWREPKHGESYWQFTRSFNILLNMQGLSSSQLTRFIGGLRRFPNHKGDKGERPPLAPIPAADQRSALATLTKTVLSENALNIPKAYLTKLTGNPNANLISSFLAGQDSYPVLDMVSEIPASTLSALLNADTASRVINNEYKSLPGTKPFTLAELYDQVGTAVWSELAGRRPVSAQRRTLQRAHVDTLMQQMLGGGVPDDSRMLAWHHLRTLAGKLASAEKAGLDEMTGIHFEETLMRIRRALDAKESLGGGQAAPASLLEQLLGGGVKKG